jgi:membrane fusion protein, multidrug efflux system
MNPKGNPAMSRARRVLFAIAAVAAAYLLYQFVFSVAAYTDDAYVRSDLVAIAPQVSGKIIAVDIADNQTVHAGDNLAAIDPEPFRLAVAEKKAEIAEAKAQLASDRYSIQAAEDLVASATSAAALARVSQGRIVDLSKNGDVSRAALDQADDELRRQDEALAIAQAGVSRAKSQTEMHGAAQARAVAELETAEWRLARTRLIAPVDGIVNNLTLRVGDTAVTDVPLIGIVDAHAWRIMANYKQDQLRKFTIGGEAWVWLDSEPWRLHRARIAGIARGISRDPEAEKLLPYVAPTTDWIRLQRRFPVTLTLIDPPADLNLFMGADARTVIFP